MAAVGHAAAHTASHGAASQVVPTGKTDKEQQILLLLVLAGVIIFIQHDVSGKPQDGTQYAALGVVGFILLVLSQFWPEVALTFTVLFVVAVVLNSPNGVPLISKATSQNGSIPAGSSGGSGSGGGNPTNAAPYTGSINSAGLGQGTSAAGGGTNALHG
jgi:hypothetical protein